jgi:hypothetical protein
VSLDGRYEVAYAPELLERHIRFFTAMEGWRGFLDELPTDAVLVLADAPVVDTLRGLPAWRAVYRDDAFQIFVRRDHPTASLPVVDRRGERLTGGARWPSHPP